MNITWLDPDRLDQRAVDGVVAVLEAARAVDTPFLPPHRTSELVAWLRHGFEGDPPQYAVGTDGSGRVVGVARVSLLRWDNHHLAALHVTVEPRLRRRGLGRRLFEAARERAAADGRRMLCASTMVPAGEAFLRALGFESALTIAHRRMDPSAADLDRLSARVGPLAEGYELLRLFGDVPEELVDDVVRMTAAINDAPTGTLDLEAEVFTPERLRAFERSQRGFGYRIYRVIARHRATGELAGHTVVAVDSELPWQAYQYDTSVVRAHRGHRLGLQLKLDMLRWLGEAEPQLRVIDTDNAADNLHMIRINEELGYQPLVTEVEWQRPV